MLRIKTVFLLIVLLGINCVSYSTEIDLHQNYTNSSRFSFKHLYIADAEGKVSQLILPENVKNRIIIMDVPILNTKDFADSLDAYYGRPIDTALIDEISNLVINYIKKRGINLVNVITPPQNVASGDIRLVVITGRYTLAKLYLSSIEKINTPEVNLSQSTQITLDEVPGFLSSPEFAHLLTPYFAQPITAESVNKLIFDISNYITKNNDYLAGVQIPAQNVEGGILRIGLKIGKFPIKRMILAESAEKALSAQVPPANSGVFALHLPVYETKEFRAFINHYLGQPISVNLITELKKDLVSYGKNHDLALVDSATPALDLANGEVRVGVIIGHYKQLHIKGNRWFSDQLLQNRLGIKPGAEIHTSDMDNAFMWSNQNPFRQVQMLIDTVGKPPGIADLDVVVQETPPARLSASYSNALNSPLGNSAYSANAQFGNLWGLDQELNYTYSTNNTPKYYQSHSFDYKIPLPWHDLLRVDFAYSLAYPQSLFGYQGLNEKAKNTVVDIGYSHSFTRGNWCYGFSAGTDYKQVNTNLVFGEYTQPITTYDVAQLILGYTVSHKDLHGSWNLSSSVNISPGEFNSRNTEAKFGYNSQGSATNMASRYEYAKLMIERDTVLPYGLQWVARAQVQAATTNLEGSEQILIGGGSTVRGYSENVAGDQGIIINQEFRSPVLRSHLPFYKHSQYLFFSTQVLSFFDYGRVTYKHPLASDIKLKPLMGTGIGLRTSITGHFSLAIDLGWRLLQAPNLNDPPMRGSFSGSLAY
jgi:hemolysin activation/secretion protein